MRDRDYLPYTRPGQARYASFLRTQRRTPGPGPAILTVVALVLVAAAITWYSVRDDAPAQALPTELQAAGVVQTPPAPAEVPAPELPTVPTAAPATQPALDLPPLDVSDEFVRGVVSELSAHPQFAAWLVNDELVHRFVATVTNLADGVSPVPHVRFLSPEQDFQVLEAEGRLFVDPASYRRYDLLTSIFVSLDPEGAAELYRQLSPLFEDAFGRLGLPQSSFDDVMAQAIDNLLAVEVPIGVMELRNTETGTYYEFANDDIERESAAAKHLLRMGPDNARRVQNKLRQLATVLGFTD